MCKLVLIPHIPKGKSKNAWRLARVLTPAMTKHDQDGFGYGAITFNEDFLAEKWLFPQDAWASAVPEEFAGLEHALQGGLDQDTYLHYGYKLDKSHKRPAIKALMLHARFSTCGGGVENSHPFVLNDSHGPWAALVHNGVVNTQGLRLEQSTCDSEGILNRMRDEHALSIPENLQAALEGLQGYYALGVLVHTYEHGWVMDIIRDASATLSAIFVYELGTTVFATYAEHIENACRKLKWRRPRVAKMRPNTRIRYSVNTGKVLLTDHFTSDFTMSGWQQAHAQGDYSQYSRAWNDDEDGDTEKIRLLKEGTYIGDAEDVQRALHAMETRAQSAGQPLTIDPVTGAIEMPDGTVLQLTTGDEEPVTVDDGTEIEVKV
jgi:hypothetical protein